MKKIKLEVGKTYRSREGEEVEIVKEANGGEYPFLGSNGEWYTTSGKWRYRHTEVPEDLIEEVRSTRHTFKIPDGTKEVTVEQHGNRIVVEMVPEAKEPKPGDVLVNTSGSVYIFKEAISRNMHKYFAWLGRSGLLVYNDVAISGRPATPEEAQPLWDALKKAGKRWSAETMKVEDITELDRIRAWVENNLSYGHHTKEGIAEAIEAYLKYRS